MKKLQCLQAISAFPFQSTGKETSTTATALINPLQPLSKLAILNVLLQEDLFQAVLAKVLSVNLEHLVCDLISALVTIIDPNSLVRASITNTRVTGSRAPAASVFNLQHSCFSLIPSRRSYRYSQTLAQSALFFSLPVDVISDQIANTSDHHHDSGEDHDSNEQIQKEFICRHID
jgi:hypothetical protein